MTISTRSFMQWVQEHTPVKSFNVRTEAQKTAHWKATDLRRSGWILAVRKQAATILMKEGEQIVRTFREARTLPAAQRTIDAYLTEQQAAWHRFYTSVYLAVGKDFANSVWRSFGLKHYRTICVKDSLEDEWTRQARRYVRTVGAQRVVGILDTTRVRVQGVIDTGIRDGATMTEMADALEDLYVGFADYRAERIARTEVIGASNFGAQEAARTTGLTLVKEWISTRDERTRGQETTDEFDHASADGQTRNLDEPYSISGEAMLFPGDGSQGASAGNVINCRCVEAYARPEDL